MKHNHSHDNARRAGPQRVSVRFEFTPPTAHAVRIVGTFNYRQPTTKSMHPCGEGHWLKETAYEFCPVVDGRWMPDPQATESVPNPFGRRNSVLKVANSPETAHLVGAENLSLNHINK